MKNCFKDWSQSTSAIAIKIALAGMNTLNTLIMSRCYPNVGMYVHRSLRSACASLPCLIRVFDLRYMGNRGSNASSGGKLTPFSDLFEFSLYANFSAYSISWNVRHFTIRHARIKRGDRGTLPSWKITNLLGFLVRVRIPWSYQISVQCWAIIGPQAKRHFNGVSLAGRWWPAFIGILSLPLPICRSLSLSLDLSLSLSLSLSPHQLKNVVEHPLTKLSWSTHIPVQGCAVAQW